MFRRFNALTLIALALISFWAITAGQIALAQELVSPVLNLDEEENQFNGQRPVPDQEQIRTIVERVMAGEIILLWMLDDDTLVEVILSCKQYEEQGILPIGAEEWETSAVIEPNGYHGIITGDGLPDCGGYWGTNWIGPPASNGKARYESDTSKYLFYWSPNCSFVPPCSDCGGGRCDDDMVSFWLGPDFTSDWSKYRVNSTSWTERLFLKVKGGASYRMYANRVNGQWFYDAYLCWPFRYSATNLRFGRLK